VSDARDNKMLSMDIIVPLFNEELVLTEFHGQLVQAVSKLPCEIRILYVDDGSSDDTPALLQNLANKDSRVAFIRFSRNFGHQSALTAGLDHADADIVIMMDGDGQHPPQLIPEMVDQFRAGYDVVLTQRSDEAGLSFLKRKNSQLFYGLINRIGNTRIIPGAADFRLLSHRAVDALRQMPEYHRFLRGMVSWVGFRTAILPYTAPARLHGSSKYSPGKMMRLAMDAIFSFSLVPLQIGLVLGLLFFVLAALEVIYVLSFWVRGKQALLVPGWSSLMFVILITGGFLMTLVGLIGNYVGYIFQEVKHRPVYVIQTAHMESRSARPLRSLGELPRSPKTLETRPGPRQ